MRRARARVCTLAALAAAGCATIENGGEPQLLTLETQPAGATAVVLPDHVVVETPAEVQLSRREAHTIRFELDGYCRETVYVDRISTPSRDLNWLLVWFGFWIDYETGAAFSLTPVQTEVHLWPADSPERECGSANALRRLERTKQPAPL
jgi:hypothetical protein